MVSGLDIVRGRKTILARPPPTSPKSRGKDKKNDIHTSTPEKLSILLDPPPFAKLSESGPPSRLDSRPNFLRTLPICSPPHLPDSVVSLDLIASLPGTPCCRLH